MGYWKINYDFLSFIFILFISFQIHSQEIKSFAGLSMSLNPAYDANGFLNVIGGFDFKATNFLRPEIKVGYVFGNTDSQIDSSSSIESIFEKNTTALYVGIVTKIVLKGQNDSYYYQILPQYNFGKLTVVGSYVEIDENSNVTFSKKEKLSEFKFFFGFGFGVHLFLSENHKEALDLNLYYQRIDFEDVISKLEYNKQSINTKNSIGFGVNYFFN